MNSTKIKVEYVNGDLINKDNFSQDHLLKLNNFSATMM